MEKEAILEFKGVISDESIISILQRRFPAVPVVEITAFEKQCDSVVEQYAQHMRALGYGNVVGICK